MGSPHDSDQDQRRPLDEAFEREGDRLRRTLHVYLRRFGLAGDRREAEALVPDLFQDVAVAAYAGLHGYDPARSAYPWLCGIALNVIRALRRKLDQERCVILPVADIPQVQAASRERDGSPMSEAEMFDLLYDPALASSTSRLRLFELLSLVTESDRQLLTWHFVEGMDDDTQAGWLGASRGAVRVKRCRAIRRFREAYARSERIVMEGK
jgi:RNA polymerase sigma factor (sigma-70 family)